MAPNRPSDRNERSRFNNSGQADQGGYAPNGLGTEGGVAEGTLDQAGLQSPSEAGLSGQRPIQSIR